MYGDNKLNNVGDNGLVLFILTLVSPEWDRLDVPSTAFFLDDIDPTTVHVVPGDPDAARSPSGTPMVSLIAAGDTALLNIGTIWWPGEDELTAGLARVAQEVDRSPAELRVSGSAVTARSVTVWVRADDGSERELGGTTPSGTPPFSAALSLAVPGAHLGAARRACLGEPGLLSVRLSGELVRGHTATTVLIAGSGREVIRHRVHLPDCDPEVIDAADRLAEERLAAARSSTRPPGGTVRVSATVRRPSAVPLTRTADVGLWIRGSHDPHIVEYHPRVEEPKAPPPAPMPVSVGFDASRSPVGRIEARSGEALTVLLPPFDRPAELAGQGEMTATVHYLNGGPAYRHPVRAGGSGWTLTLADLGLAEVRVDATALRDRGATRVRGEVHYQPSGEGTSERRAIELGPDRWTMSWHVVSRAPDLAGELLVTGLDVTPPGIDAPMFLRSATPHISL
ncbi:MAG: hypothetical protein JWQ95_6259 [Sphaerisporangium sp.]|jgi:hypothetical protein|nr:hypothetical protein [Sphaerisporangium sp.]